MDKAYKENFIKAGVLAKQVRDFGKSLIIRGASYNQVIQAINEKIILLGAIPAFPPQIALDNTAAHYLPEPGSDIIFSNQVIKLDIGICYNGAIGDTAVTIDLSGKYQKLIDSAEAALLAAEKIIEVGLPIKLIGQTIEKTIASFGFTSIKNLAGHGLGYYKIHTSPSIPNCDVRTNERITPNMTFAIEPFATDGHGLIYEINEPTIYSFIANQHVKSQGAQELLKRIKMYKGLPFAIHSLVTENVTIAELKKQLLELTRAKVIAGYGPLMEQGKGIVAQAENSVLVDEKGHVHITTR